MPALTPISRRSPEVLPMGVAPVVGGPPPKDEAGCEGVGASKDHHHHQKQQQQQQQPSENAGTYKNIIVKI